MCYSDENHLQSKSEYSEINKTWVDNKEKFYRTSVSQKIASHTKSEMVKKK